MYGLPENFDGSFFIGLRLEVVSFTESTIYLGFVNDNNVSDVSVTVSSSFQHCLPGEKDGEMQRVPLSSSCLMQLVGRSVEAVNAEEQGTLTFVFSGGHIFRCFDDMGNFECYQIAHGDEEIYV
ncbi:MAG: hypothetical protein PVH19_08810 [Planctomycetia bacterium]|jgi:hypothetical protein